MENNMKNQTLFVAAIAALAVAGCAKSASVQGQSGGTLTLDTPAAMTLHRGGMAKTDIKIGRKNLAGDVTVSFKNLPKGVDVVDADNKIVGDHASYTLRAGDTADLVENFAADVTASVGPGNISVSEPMNISVKAKE
jgi:hypothetical protein